MPELGDDGAEPFDPLAATLIVDDQSRSAVTALDVRSDRQLMAWGAAWLIGLGSMWLEVRVQQPYTGPTWTLGVLALALTAAGSLVGIHLTRATRGIGGESALRGRIERLAWSVGFLALFVFAVAMNRLDPSPEVMGLVLGCGAMAVTGFGFLVNGAAWANPVVARVGVALLVLAAIAGFAGPVGQLAIAAVVGGGAMLGTGAWLSSQRRAR